MDSIQMKLFTFCLIFCSTTGKLLRTELIRVKRWEGNGDMSNMGNNGDMSNMFRGTAGVDYPDYKTIPTTNFRCSEQQYEGGLYADVDTQCQVYHVCHDGRKDSFMCGRGTIFNQQILACDYWYSTECDTAPSFYYVNSQIGGPASPWVPEERNSQINNQPIAYQPYGGADNGQSLGQSHGNSNSDQQDNDQKSCCCLKNTYKAPWNFPSSLVTQNRK